MRAFVLAMDLGSISSAARQLNKGQPLVSQWIADLEADLNLTLFQRSGNKTLATDQARALLPYARKLLQAEDELQQVSRALSDGEPTQLVIAIDEWIPALALQPALVKWMAQFPRISLDVRNLPRQQILTELRHGGLDLAFLSELEHHHPGLAYRRIGFYDEMYVAGPGLAAQLSTPVALTELQQQREILWSRADVQEEDSLIGDGEAFAPDFIQLSDLGLTLELLKQNQGYALLPKQLVQAELDNGSLIDLQVAFEQTALQRRIETIWRQGADSCDVLSALIAAIDQYHQYGR